MPFPASGAAIDPSVPISAIEEELRRLGLGNSQMGTVSVLPPPPMTGTEDPQSAVAAILAGRQVPSVAAVAPPEVALPPPTPEEPPQITAPSTGEGDGGIPWWLLPLVGVAGAIAGRGIGKKAVARVGKGGAKTAKAVDTAAGEIKEPGKGVQHPPRGTGLQHPGMQKKKLSAPTEPKLLTYRSQAAAVSEPPSAAAALPPPTLTQVDVPQSVQQALVERARGNIRGPVSNRMPPEPTPRPVLPAYTEPLDEATDFSQGEIGRAVRIAIENARRQEKSAAKTARLNKKRPAFRQQYTPDRSKIPQEERERKSWNVTTEIMRRAKNPPKAETKDLKPWLKEPKKDIGKPVLPKGKKPRGKPKPKSEVVKELNKRKKAKGK